MKALLAVGFALGVAGCAVEVQYTKPETGYDKVVKQANDKYEYISLTSAYIVVAPVADLPGAKAVAPSPSPATSANGAGTDAKNKASAAKTPPVAANAKPPGKAQAPTAATSAVQVPPPGDTTKPQPTLGDALAKVQINDKTWGATVVLLPDEEHTLMVKGVSNFWQSTTLAISKYQNSDAVTSVSSTAKNLVPQRLQQLSEIVVAIAAIGGAAAAGGEDLQPFVADVSKIPVEGKALNGGWTYDLAYSNADTPPGTVAYKDFVHNVAGKTVSYWPVPACRNAQLTIHGAAGRDFVFPVVVSSPDLLRLQPLPVDGKITLGSVCGSSVTGTMTSDPVADVDDDVKALQAAIKAVKGSASAPAASVSAAKK
jgi:hypothetical protein